MLKGSIRIFLLLGSVEDSFHTFKSINNKFYNDRKVSLRFYQEQLYRSRDLGHDLHEHINT